MTSATDAPRPVSVLVVDDNPDDLRVFQRALRNSGWTVETAEKGSSGLERALAERFDVIVLDYNLGDMTGTEILLRLKEKGVMTPVLIQSGLGSDFIVARALTLGAEGFIAKDAAQYDQEVASKVAAALQRSRAAGLGTARAVRRESVEEVETVLDDLLERSRGQLIAVGFASPDGFRVSTRFKTARKLTPETICAMVASAASTCNFLGEGLNLPGLRSLSAEFQSGRLFAAPVPGFGVVFAALADAKEPAPTAKSDVEFAARELSTLLGSAQPAQQY